MANKIKNIATTNFIKYKSRGKRYNKSLKTIKSKDQRLSKL